MTRFPKPESEPFPVPAEKIYYRIGEVSRITGLKPHVLRYWESEFRIIKPYKGGSLHRLYRKRDLDLILRIKKLLYEDGFTIAGAKKKIRDVEGLQHRYKKTDGRDRELLMAVREELQGIRRMLS